jgi:hypothetical protein
MDQTVLLWILGSINAANVVVMGAIAKGLFDHIKECREVRSTLSAHEERVKSMEKEVSTLRIIKHENAKTLSHHSYRLRLLDGKDEE